MCLPKARPPLTGAALAASLSCGAPRGDRNRNISAVSTGRMRNACNAALRQYVVEHHYMDTLEFHAISGAAIIDKFGYKECPLR